MSGTGVLAVPCATKTEQLAALIALMRVVMLPIRAVCSVATAAGTAGNGGTNGNTAKPLTSEIAVPAKECFSRRVNDPLVLTV